MRLVSSEVSDKINNRAFKLTPGFDWKGLILATRCRSGRAHMKHREVGVSYRLPKESIGVRHKPELVVESDTKMSMVEVRQSLEKAGIEMQLRFVK